MRIRPETEARARAFGDGPILLVDDDPAIADAIGPYISLEGAELVWVRSVEEAERELSGRTPAIALVDRTLPGRSGDELARRLADDGIPFIMLTARAREHERLVGFDLGAEDYVVKPFSPRELTRRITVALRRRGVRRVTLAEGVELDPDAFLVRVHREPVALTRTEYALLEILAARPERVFTRAELADRLHLDLDTSERALDSHVKNLRRKLRDAGAPGLVQTAVGLGYTLSETSR
jgi:two-component system response regulator BaeR